MGDKILLAIATVLVGAFAIGASKAGANEHSGNWTLNVAKSKHGAGAGPQELHETIELDEHHYKVEANGRAPDGQPVHFEFNAKFDEKEYPMIGAPWADTVSVRWTDDHQPQMIQRKRGQVTMTITCKVSADGKTRTCTLQGRDAEGRNVNEIAVFDRR